MTADTPQTPGLYDRHRKFLDAAEIGDAETVRKLVDTSGIDINYATPGTGLTALHLAAARNALAVVRILAATGRCDYALKDAKGRTAAALAISVARNPVLGRYLTDLQYKMGVAAMRRPTRRGSLSGQGEA